MDNEIWLEILISQLYILYLGLFRSWQCNPGKWRFDIMMVRNEWHPLVRGTFKHHCLDWSAPGYDFELHWQNSSLYLGFGFLSPAMGRSWKDWDESWAREMWHVTIEPSFTGFLDFSPKFVTIRAGPHGGTRQFWWLLLPKKSFLERSALPKKDSAELVAFHQVDGFFMSFCSIFLLFFDESFQGLTGLL